MLTVNIIHSNDNLLEYTFLSLFFRFFGFPVYHTHTHSYNELVKILNSLPPSDEPVLNSIFSGPELVQGVPNASNADEGYEFEKDTFFRIVIANKAPGISECVLDASLNNSEENISQVCSAASRKGVVFVSSYESSPEPDDVFIPFPDKLDEEKCSEFLNSVLQKLLSSIESCELYEKELLSSEMQALMIKMFLDCNLMNNWYMPLRVIRCDRERIKGCIDNLKGLAERYEGYISDAENSPFLVYAALNLKYMANSLCEKYQSKPVLDWDAVISDVESLLQMKYFKTRRLYYLIGEMYYESNKNNMLAEECYLSGSYSKDYYTCYKNARLNEFRYDNMTNAERLLKKSLQYNPSYYRSLYKLGIYCSTSNAFDQALKYYTDVINCIIPLMASNCWNTLDMEYILKTFGRVLELNSHFKSKDLVPLIKSMVDSVKSTESVERNEFFNQLSQFIPCDKQDIVEDVNENIKRYYEQFCKIYLENII